MNGQKVWVFILQFGIDIQEYAVFANADSANQYARNRLSQALDLEDNHWASIHAALEDNADWSYQLDKTEVKL